MPQSQIPQLKDREENIKKRLVDLEKEFEVKSKTIKYHKLKESILSELVGVKNKLANLGTISNLVTAKGLYAMDVSNTATNHQVVKEQRRCLIHLTNVSIEDALVILDRDFPDFQVHHIEDVAVKVVLPSRY